MIKTQLPPLISIVTVVFNGVSTIEDTINSVLSQQYSNFEYIIVDGGSTDGTIEIIKRYESKITAWVSTPDDGIYDAMNKALGLISGDFVLFLGCDDLLLGDDVLSTAANKIHDRNFVYYGNVVMKKSGAIYDGLFDKFKMTRKNICHQAIFYPRHLYLANRYSLKYPLLADYEYNIRFFDQFLFIDMVVSLFNDSGQSNQQNDVRFQKDFHGLVLRHFGLEVYLKMIAHSIARMCNHLLHTIKLLFNRGRGGMI